MKVSFSRDFHEKPTPTRYPELGYQKMNRDLWRIIDLSTGQAVGAHYRTKAELLADLGDYARVFGYA